MLAALLAPSQTIVPDRVDIEQQQAIEVAHHLIRGKWVTFESLVHVRLLFLLFSAYSLVHVTKRSKTPSSMNSWKKSRSEGLSPTLSGRCGPETQSGLNASVSESTCDMACDPSRTPSTP